jgi:formylglycine-generating enzyme required for sulfatase activity
MARALLDSFEVMLFHIIASTACVTLFGIMPGHAQTRGAVHPLTAEQERALKPTDSFKECDKCPEMVVVPAGSFTMGSPASEDGHQSHESPQHPVTFARQFAVGRFAVTFDEWDACVADGGCNDHKPSEAGWGRGRQPVINVSWDDAKAYVAWLARKTGKNYRLLSEAEREYVTRAGTTTPFCWGSSISTSQANYDGRFNYGGGAKGESRRRTLPVDSFQPNPWGLFQVHGNVWTWVEDCWHESYEGAPADGSAWTAGDCSRRVIRGGSYGSPPRLLRSANRIWFPSGHRDFILGFRVGRTLTP